MVEKVITPGRNVVDFAKYQQERKIGAATISAKYPGFNTPISPDQPSSFAAFTVPD